MNKSYGENRLEVNGRWVGKVRLLNMHGQKELYPRLQLSLGWTLGPLHVDGSDESRETELQLRDFRGELRHTEHDDGIAIVHWIESRTRAISSAYTTEGLTVAVCELDRARLARLEERRAGNALALWLQLSPTVVTASGRQIHSEIRPFLISVPRDDWLRVLDQVGHGHREILEVPVPMPPGGQFEMATKHVHKALTMVDSGDYQGALMNCRKAIEAVSEALATDDLSGAFAALTDERRSKHYAGIVSRLKQLADVAVHNYGTSSQFSRAETLFIVRTSAGVVALCGDLFAKRNPESSPAGKGKIAKRAPET